MCDDSVKWHTNPWMNCPKFQHLAWTIINLQWWSKLPMCVLTLFLLIPVSIRQTRRIVDSQRNGTQRQHVGETHELRIIGTFVMLKHRLFQDADFAGDLADSKSQHQAECSVHQVITCLYLSHGHARNRRQCHTAAQKLRRYHWTCVRELKGYLHEHGWLL